MSETLQGCLAREVKMTYIDSQGAGTESITIKKAMINGKVRNQNLCSEYL